jgi:hypothetical protein
VHGLRQTYHRLRKRIERTRWELLGDVGHVEAHFGPFGDSANLDARYVHGLHRTYQRLENRFGRTQWNS